MAENKKKDLTSLIELSNLEMEKKPPEPTSPAIPEQTATDSKTLEAEFASLDTLTITPEVTTTAAPPPASAEQTVTSEPTATVTQLEATETVEPKVTQPTETAIPDLLEPSLTAIEPAATEMPATEPSILMPEPTQVATDLSSVKKFVEKRTIGKPRVEASPAFSLLATGKFSAKAKKIIENAVGGEDFGVSVQDISVQLKSGKLFVPQISEFAAIILAQKIRDVVDSIEIGLADEIFKGSSAELAPEQTFVTEEQSQKEAHDLETEPLSEEEVFSSNLNELQGFKITRVLSTLTISEILSKEIAESPSSKKFETVTQRLTKELISRAFKLRANGVMGINFSLIPIQKAYRILATGTAIRGKKISS